MKIFYCQNKPVLWYSSICHMKNFHVFIEDFFKLMSSRNYLSSLHLSVKEEWRDRKMKKQNKTPTVRAGSCHISVHFF